MRYHKATLLDSARLLGSFIFTKILLGIDNQYALYSRHEKLSALRRDRFNLGFYLAGH